MAAQLTYDTRNFPGLVNHSDNQPPPRDKESEPLFNFQMYYE